MSYFKNIILELAYIDHGQARKTVTQEEGISWKNTISSTNTLETSKG